MAIGGGATRWRKLVTSWGSMPEFAAPNCKRAELTLRRGSGKREQRFSIFLRRLSQSG